MKTLSKIAVVCLLLFASCSAIRGWNTNNLALGMDKDTAYKSMGQKPASVVVAKQYPSGTLEVVEYSQSFYNAAGTLDPPQKAWLYFFNNKLVQYGKPGNLEEQEDHILSMQQTKE